MGGQCRSGQGLGVADRQSGEGDLAQCLDQRATGLHGIMAALANGAGELTAQVGQGRGRLVDQGGQTRLFLVLGMGTQAAFAGRYGHGIGDHQGRVAQLAWQHRQHLLQQGLTGDFE